MVGRTLAGVAAILAFSTTLAAAAPAALERNANVRAGPGTNYPVIATLPAGATVDVNGSTGSWCQVNTSAGQGFVACSLLGGGSGAVAVAPGYGYDDDYYDYGYAYGPGVGVYVAPGHRHWRHRHGWRGHDGRGNWAGRPDIGRGNWTGNRGGSSSGVNIPGKRQPGAAASFGGRSTVGASPSIRGGASVGAGRGSVGGGASVGSRSGSFGGGGGASVGGGSAPAKAMPGR